jgi:ABC-type transport system substrate-binding protein
MRRLLQLIGAMSRWERWTLGVLAVLAVVSLFGLSRIFYLRNTELLPGTGGTYIEGSVGELQPLDPWFIVQNDVNRDIVSLVFSGLLRYNPHSKKIEEDLATMKRSGDGRVYTLTLKDDIFWHDTTKSEPHPVTADDVVFTFSTIQQAGFPNPLLQENFRGVKIDKIDEKTVKFTLERPYNFFPSNLTLGLLPKKSFDGIPISKLIETVDFGLAPVGAGPYKVKTVVRTELSTEVTLERFDRTLPPPYRLDRVVFRIFPDYSSLLTDLRNLDGVRLVPRNEKGEPIIPKRFTALNYTLPQYVALFFNLEKPALQDQKLRQGLQQGTDKQKIVDLLHESVIVDTPLLEINQSDWHYKFDPDAAQGALFASKWNVPERVRLQRVLEEEDANKAGLVRPPSPVVLLKAGGSLTLSGAYTSIPRDAIINGIHIGYSGTNSGTWIVQLPFLTGTGALQPGVNLVKITAGKGRIVDSFYVTGVSSNADGERALQERKLADLYRQTRDGKLTGAQAVNIQQLVMDNGMLRRRVASDPPSIRINEKGEPLKITILTSNKPDAYGLVAQEIKRQWAQLGVLVTVDVPTNAEDFQERLLRRQYDVVLFGQSLLDNLDSFPYWHSSGVQKLTGNDKDLRSDAYNLSQYVSFKADSALNEIRETNDEDDRQKALKTLQGILKDDVPAIFLYSPVYVFAHHSDILGVELGALSLHSDRFLTLNNWYIKQERVFKNGKSWLSFPGWIFVFMTGQDA